MLRIDGKIAMFSPLIKVLFTRTEMSMLRIDDNITMFSPLIKVRTLHVECFAALQPCSLLLNVQVFIVSLCRCCATAAQRLAASRRLAVACAWPANLRRASISHLAGLVPTVECSKSV